MSKKTYVALKIGVIAGIFCQLNKELELTDKEAAPYLEKGFIKLKKEVEETTPATSTTENKETATEPLTLEAIEAMGYHAMKSKVAELDLEVEDKKSETLKAALIATVEVE